MLPQYTSFHEPSIHWARTNQVIVVLAFLLLQVKYTCKLCGTTTTKAVNPHAWATGTVFGRCEGCQVIHKLTDNLELFHELSGSIISSPISPDSISIPEGLPQKPYMP